MTGSAPGGAQYNAAAVLGDNLVAGRAELPYLRTAEKTWSYEEVVAAADAAGAGLRDVGLEQGDRALIALGDSPEFAITFWGAIKAGLIPVPVAPRITDDDLSFVVGDSRAGAIVCDATSARASVPATERASIHCLVTGGSSSGNARSWSEVCGRNARLAAAATTGDDIALWFYTSGTTGFPKAVMHRHRAIGMLPVGLGASVFDMQQDDVLYSGSKMSFAFPLLTTLVLTAWAGASVVVDDAPSVPGFVCRLLERYRPTIVTGVPALYAGLLDLAAAEIPHSVRIARSGGEKLPVALFERFRERFGITLLEGMGASEAPYLTCNRPDDIVPGSVGRVIPPYEIEARNVNGRPVGNGASGELWVRGPTTFAGYWGHPDLTAHVYDGEWLRTGDLIRIENGVVFHEGRIDDLLRIGGTWVTPLEVEDLLRSHPDVDDAAVVAAEGRFGIAIVKAFLVSARRDANLRSEVVRLCRRRLAAHKIPALLEVVSELPRTDAGKLNRSALS